MPERMKPYAVSSLLFLLVVYFGVQALTGDRGLLSGAERVRTMAAREARLERLEAERQDLEVRVRYLRTDSLSRDLLEERARAVLGYADPRDYVIQVRHAPEATPSPRHS